MGEKKDKPTEETEKKSEKGGLSRRDFLKGMGAGTVAAAMVTTAPYATEAEAAALAKGVREMTIQTEINGQSYRLPIRAHWTLLEMLRRDLGLTGTKKSCDRGSCGSCTVIMDGRVVYACAILALEAHGRKIVTIEGLSEGEKLHPIQEAFVREDAFQCGFCTPAMILSTKALLDRNPAPDKDEIKEALSGTVCRCGAYPKIVKAVASASRKA